MTVELPPQYSWGFVVGRVIHAIADTTDDEDRFPEARGANGTVTFTPSTRLRRHTEPPASFILKETVTAEIVNGVLIDAEQQQGIYLISGPYRVEFSIRGGSIPSFAIEVTEEHTLTNPLDLVTAAPYVPSPGTPVTTLVVPAGMADDEVLAWRDGGLVWVPGAAQAEAAADRAETAEGLASTHAENASTSAQTASEAQGHAQAAQSAAEAARDGAVSAMPHIIVGAGRPDIPGTLDPDIATRVAAAPSGAVFRSTDGPQGAWEWQKRGTTWVVTSGDTGWIDVSTLLTSDWESATSAPFVRVRRTTDTIHLGLRISLVPTSPHVGVSRAGNRAIFTTNLFSAETYAALGSAVVGTTLTGVVHSLTSLDRPQVSGFPGTWAAGDTVQALVSYPPSRTLAWPTTLTF